MALMSQRQQQTHCDMNVTKARAQQTACTTLGPFVQGHLLLVPKKLLAKLQVGQQLHKRLWMIR